MTAAGSTNVSDVRIKFQQYDNFPATSDGREFDNIRVTVVTTAPEIQVSGNSQVIADGDTVPSLSDYTDFGSILTGGSVVRTFTITNTGTGTLNLTGTPRVQLTGSADFTVVVQPAATVGAGGGTTTFQVQFTPSGTGLKMALIQIASNDGDESPYDFTIQGTSVLTVPEIELVGNSQVIADGDTVPSLSDHTEFGSVPTGGSVVRTFTIRNTGSGTLNLTGTPRVQLTGSGDFTVIAQPAGTVAAGGGTTTFQVQFTPGSAGLKMALVQIVSNDGDENPYDFTIQGTGTTQVAQAVPYTQDFSLGKPGIGQGWEYYTDTEGRIEVVSGRLRMDDIAGNTTYGANEAILHVDLTGRTGVTLTLDHVSLSDENHALPSSFVGQYKGDGIVLSVDGQHWIKVTDLTTSFTNGSFGLDTIVQQAMTAAGSTNVSDVRIKFQQYDNFPAISDGREFDNIRIT
jgi:hypothetical protein